MSTYGVPSGCLFGGSASDAGDNGHGRPSFGPAHRADSPPEVKAEAREMTASGKRSAKCEAVLAALRDGPKTGDQLIEWTGSHRFGARIKDLRDHGFVILSTPLGGWRWLYSLMAERKEQ